MSRTKNDPLERSAECLAEGDVDTAYISALSALGGATIGGLASFGSSWLTQRTQLRFAHYEAVKAKREELYAAFVDEASRLYGDALGHQKDDPADLVKLYALTGRIRLVSPRPVVTAAERTLDMIIEAYLGPNRTLHEVLEDVHRGGFHFFTEFGEACRQDLVATEGWGISGRRWVDIAHRRGIWARALPRSLGITPRLLDL